MKFFGKDWLKKPNNNVDSSKKPNADWDSGEIRGGFHNHLFTISYDGEKNLGEIGPLKHYLLNYEALRLRSWEAVLTSDIANTVLLKLTSWVIGSGLKVQAEPSKVVLKSEGITLNSEDFNRVSEARFKIYGNSKKCDYAKQSTLGEIANIAYKNAEIAGDLLVILRYDKNNLSIQLIDGSNVCSPLGNSNFFGDAALTGNKILHGIEFSKTGEHIAYYVRNSALSYERIPARGENSGAKMAFLVYGRKHRIDNCRGIPLLATVLESLSKIERYKEATVGSAEERQKIVYAIEHGINSTGEDPRTGNVTKAIIQAHDADAKKEVPVDINGIQLADKIAVTTNKTTFNMPNDSKLTSLDSKNELSFKDFFETNFNFFCSAVEVPPEVAKAMYNSNYSASRAAIKEWGHTLDVKRKYFSDQFYQEIWNFWLYIEILKNKIQAPGYLEAIAKENDMVIGAYHNARFIGPSVPQIDPVKEVEAIRRKLGESAAAIPLITIEQATEELANGDSDSNMEQFALEMQQARKLKIVQQPEKVIPPKT